MSGSNRSKLAKTGLTILAVVVALSLGIWIINSGLTRDSEYQWQADDHSDEYAAYTQEQIRKACLLPSGIYEANCVAEKRHEYREDRREERDLVAQRKSANWAYIMGAAAVLGMVLSAVGVVLVWITFRETRKANEIAVQLGQIQAKAYLQFKLSALSLHDSRPNTPDVGYAGPRFVVTMDNTGATPARDIKMTVSATLTKGSVIFSALPHLQASLDVPYLHPKDGARHYNMPLEDFTLGAADLALLQAGGFPVIVAADIAVKFTNEFNVLEEIGPIREAGKIEFAGPETLVTFPKR